MGILKYIITGHPRGDNFEKENGELVKNLFHIN